MGTAAGVGALRVLSGKHFPSDVAAGALVGSLIGYGVPRMHLKKRTFGMAGSSPGAGLFPNLEMNMGFAPDGVSPMLLITAHLGND